MVIIYREECSICNKKATTAGCELLWKVLDNLLYVIENTNADIGYIVAAWMTWFSILQRGGKLETKLFLFPKKEMWHTGSPNTWNFLLRICKLRHLNFELEAVIIQKMKFLNVIVLLEVLSTMWKNMFLKVLYSARIKLRRKTSIYSESYRYIAITLN